MRQPKQPTRKADRDGRVDAEYHVRTIGKEPGHNGQGHGKAHEEHVQGKADIRRLSEGSLTFDAVIGWAPSIAFIVASVCV